MGLQRRYRPLLACLLVLAPLAAARADDLANAYAAILRGDYSAGRTEIAKLGTAPSDPRASEISAWLDSFNKMELSRQELRSKTIAWLTEQAQKADAAGKTFLALSFAARISDYTLDEKALSNEPWIKSLTEKALAEGKRLEDASRWRDATSFYAQLARIHPDDDKLDELREHAARHARLELIYADREAFDRRIKNVDKTLLKNVVRKISDSYYREPDWKAMALGALRQLDALAETKKLFEIFDGLANPALRAAFRTEVARKKAEIEQQPPTEYKELLRLFNDLATINKSTVELNEALLVIEFLEGATQELDDFTAVVWPADAAEFDKMMMGEFQGVGIQLGVDESTNRLKVVTPLEDSPALEAGVEPGDLIIEVDGRSTKGWTTEDAVREITGPAGTKVTLILFRPSTGQRLEMPLTRREIKLRSVRGVERMSDDSANHWNYLLDRSQGVAYIRLTGFNAHSPEELKKALEAAKKQGMRGLILDLRYNPGGLLNVAIGIAGEFLSKCEIVSTNGRRDRRETLVLDSEAEYPDLPLIVLVNEGSASASEILAGALQDHKRALVIGERTFGKGSVQNVLPLDRNARLKLTTALYYLPSGRSPHKMPKAEQWGVDPGLVYKLMPKEIRKVIEHERDTGVIREKRKAEPTISEEDRKKNLEALKDELKSDDQDEPLLSPEDITLLDSDPNQAPDVDPQLEVALLQMRARLAANMPWPRQLLAAKEAPKSTP